MKIYIKLIAFLLLVNLGCQKDEPEGGSPCADCAPTAPSVNIAVRNSNDEDLLYTKTVGSISSSQIKLYLLEPNGTVRDIPFTLRPPFTADGKTFRFYQISSPQMVTMVSASTAGVYYLKLGNNAAKKLELKLNGSLYRTDKLLVDDVEAPTEKDINFALSNGNVFYINL